MNQKAKGGLKTRVITALTLLVRELPERRSELQVRVQRKDIDLYDVTISESEVPRSERSVSIALP